MDTIRSALLKVWSAEPFNLSSVVFYVLGKLGDAQQVNFLCFVTFLILSLKYFEVI